MWVPSLYSAIEQGFKLLIQFHQGNPGRRHLLSDLYDKLDAIHKRHIEDAYEGYVELYDGPYSKIKKFLDRIDVGPPREGQRHQDGYTTWRYLLLEGFPQEEEVQPRVSIGAMLEIARAIGHILRHFIIREEVVKFPTIIVRLHEALAGEMREIADGYCRRPEIEEAVDSGQEWSHHFWIGYSRVRSLVNRNIGFFIDVLSPRSQHERAPEGAGDLKRVGEFMRGFDRENFLQYCLKVQAGTLCIP